MDKKININFKSFLFILFNLRIKKKIIILIVVKMIFSINVLIENVTL